MTPGEQHCDEWGELAGLSSTWYSNRPSHHFRKLHHPGLISQYRAGSVNVCNHCIPGDAYRRHKLWPIFQRICQQTLIYREMCDFIRKFPPRILFFNIVQLASPPPILLFKIVQLRQHIDL